jgi:hypothetical protein
MNARASRASATDRAKPTPRGSAPIRLATADEIRLEMAKVYRQAKRGEIPTEVATRLVYILGEIRKAHELMVLEAQVTELEKLYAEGSSRPSATPVAPARLLTLDAGTGQHRDPEAEVSDR